MHRPERRWAGRPTRCASSLPQVLHSNLWRLHGRVAFARGEQSRAIALHNRALKQAEIAHDSRAIGLAHFYLGQCYRQVGDMAIVREHIAEAAAALHAAGDRRHLAMVHSLSAVMLAQTGRYDEANAALRQAERMASLLQADDVLATVYGNQANVALIRHRYEQALALAERAVNLHEGLGQGPGLAVALATLGQICVRVGNLDRADKVLHRALDVRSAMQFHETTGAVYDTLAQMSLMRGDYENAAEYLREAAEAYGAYGRNTSRWYEWSLRVISARLATRRGRPDEALAIADEIAKSTNAPPAETIEAELIAAEALLSADRVEEAERRLTQVEPRLDPRTTPGAWGEFLRLRGDLRARQTRTTEAYHDIAQSSSVFELVGERYQAAVSQLALARLAAKAGAKSTADRHYEYAAQVFQALGRHARSRTGARRDGRRAAARHRRICRLARRCRRCAGAAAGGCGGVARPARARACRHVTRGRDRRRHRRLRRIAGRRRPPDRPRGHRCRRRAQRRAPRDSGRRLRRRRVDPRADWPRARRPTLCRDRRGTPAGPSAASPRSHDGGGGASGLRSLRRARSSIGRGRLDDGTAARTAAAGIPLRQRRRWSASSIRSSGCRATTSRC